MWVSDIKWKPQEIGCGSFWQVAEFFICTYILFFPKKFRRFQEVSGYSIIDRPQVMSKIIMYSIISSKLPHMLFLKGCQTSRGHKRWIFVDKISDFSWTLLVTSRGQNVHEKSSFWVNFHGHFLGEFSWTFWVNFHHTGQNWV